MAKPDDTVNFLVTIPLFQGLNNKQLNQLAKRFVPRSYESGKNIVTQGKGGEGMFVMVSGRAEAVVESSDGSKTKVNDFAARDFFGEVAMLDDGPRTASVTATADTECLVLTRSDLIALMKMDADMGIEIAIALAKRLRRVASMM
ncbi:MAG TPA: cyclic nucleotide-binding domain-containing protein [Anaerolineales bacterium]|nr:cyclic nucleotide-binding domain-containing protein [Anaerolineales bacterium]